ncbi:hypothetical protein H4R24_001950 [Coemansia sp. RSA 988]|nr:hypothetical protein H4R24_001950 [Coemansia sp. RSA 988]
MSTKGLSTAIRSILEKKGIISQSTETHMEVLTGYSASDEIIGDRKLFTMDIVGGKKLFVKYCAGDAKLNQRAYLSMFEAELAGLKALHCTNTVKVPEPFAIGEFAQGAFFVAEYIDFQPLKDQCKLGKQLAALHLVKGPELFGFDNDNWIGATPQLNKWHKSWVEFLHMRLKYQFDLANFSGPPKEHATELLRRLPEFFEGLIIRPSLVHGDLWCGSSGTDKHGNPVIFDPAVY